MTNDQSADARRDALVERLFDSALGSLDLFGVYIGSRLGLFRALAEHGALSSAQLADAAAVNERYAREWLEHQAATGILAVDDPTAPDDERRYVLPAGHDEALLDEGSLNFITPIARLVVACVRPLDEVLHAFRFGGGVPFAHYGADLHEGQAAFTRPMFDKLLGQEWLPTVTSIDERLRRDPPARVADLACGEGHSSIAIARAYTNVRVDGFDSDDASIAAARRHLAGSDVEDRVSFECTDVASLPASKDYDLVHIFEALHDMSYPVEVLTAARGLLNASGAVLVGDERVGDTFTAPADPIERFCYGVSVLHCLPVGMVGDAAAGTGTVIRADTVRRYAEAAGFSSFDVVPIDNDFYRFYSLTP